MQDDSIRQKILYTAIMLYAKHGYERVSLRQIADESGIRTSLIFEYYESKETLLHEIYNLYQENIHAKRLAPEDYEPILQRGSAEEIANIFNYPLPENIMIEMFYANLIIWTRRYLDPAAKAIYLKTIVQDSYAYIEQVLSRGIEIGRIKMDYQDIKIFAAIALGIRENSANATVIDPDQRKWRIQETETNRMLSKLLNVTPVSDEGLNRTAETELNQTVYSSSEYLINNAIKNESYAATRYYYFAEVAKRRGDERAAALLMEIAENNIDNALALNEIMEGRKTDGVMPIDLSVAGILKETIKNEDRKASFKYPAFEKTAENEGADELAGLFREIIDIAAQHKKLCVTALNERSL